MGRLSVAHLSLPRGIHHDRGHIEELVPDEFATKEELQILVKKYEVTKSGSNKEVAERLIRVRGSLIPERLVTLIFICCLFF